MATSGTNRNEGCDSYRAFTEPDEVRNGSKKHSFLLFGIA